MGPYYRGTSQGMGKFFDLFYQYPMLMLFLLCCIVVGGVLIWRKKNKSSETINHQPSSLEKDS